MSISPIILADAPAIAGLSFRHVRGVKDADALYAVQVRRMAHDKIDLFCASEGFPTRDSLHAELAQAVAESRQDQWLVAQIDERVVGYSQIECWPEGDGTWVYLTLGWVLPEWRQASPVTYRTRRATPAVKKDSALHPRLS